MPKSQQLREVVARAEQFHGARPPFERAVIDAHDAGHSLREIATAAQISHEGVRRVLAKRTDRLADQMARDQQRAEGALAAERNAERDERLAKRRGRQRQPVNE